MTEDLSWRNYRFRAGRLHDKLLKDLTDEQVEWAIQENIKYIRKHEDPMALVRWGHGSLRVFQLPDGKAEERIRLANNTLDLCRREHAWRAISVPPKAKPAKDFMHQALTRSLSHICNEMMEVEAIIRNLAVRQADLAASLAQVTAELEKKK